MAAPPQATPSASNTDPRYSPAVQTVVEIAVTAGPQLAWDGYWRAVYAKLNTAFAQQATTLLNRSNIEVAEMTPLLVAQRNALVIALRKPLSPFGRLYSEIRKPSSALPTIESLLQKKGSFDAVLKSVGKTSQVVDNFAFTTRVAGHGFIVLQVVVTAVVIASAPPEERGRVAAREGGRALGGAAGFAAGAWAGCAGAFTLGLPTLIVPVWGEAAEATACIVGAAGGGLGLGYLAGEGTGYAAEKAYDFTSTMAWGSN